MDRRVVIRVLVVIIGLCASWTAAGLLQALLFQTGAHDPRIFPLAAAVLTAVTLLASYFPPRRAARLDPLRGLTSD